MKKFDINNLVRENVLKMKPYSSARDEFKDFDVAQMVFLDANENPLRMGEPLSDPQQVKAVSSTTKISPNQILLGNGSDEVLICFSEPFANQVRIM
jgi:histidinol-phosphate aminotransferase